ncbi:MAG: hypothetical protein AAGA18_08025 [Verrucomicrobiota bacterium]
MKKKTFPPRLHAIFATNSDEAIVIRRGLSKYVCTIGWDRKKDEFKVGQWLHGRIYERRSDLSPDGKYFIYFAMNGKWDSEMQGSWSAISFYPYLKAFQIWAKGDCWFGGGIFVAKDIYWLNDDPPVFRHQLKQQRSLLKRTDTFPWHESYGGECQGVYFIRLQRTGWNLVDKIESGNLEVTTIFEKELKRGWVLRKFARAGLGTSKSKACYYDEHELENHEKGIRLNYKDWEWADYDKVQRRICCATEGKLYYAKLNSHELTEVKELYDFTDMKFQAIDAPYF